MAIREDLVASAAQFLHDPSVATSPIENRISFLRSKNLTQEEIDAALARAGPTTSTQPSPVQAPSPQPAQQPYYQPYVQNPWQQPPPPVPRRDWRDWFIMATMVSGVGYGLYSITKRYVYPMIAPPTPEKLEQDKKSIEDQFEKAFALVEQLARDTEALKAAEKDRTERLDTAMSELETVINELKAANRRREDDAQRLRDEIQGLKDSLPAALEAQKSVADSRLKEVNTELLSLKTLISRMGAPAPATPPAAPAYARATNGISNNATAVQPKTATAESENDEADAAAAPVASGSGAEAAKGSGRTSPQPSGTSTGKVSIPAWQLAMSNKGETEASGSS